MTELVMLPAIRALIVPPFWAIGSSSPVTGCSWGLATVGGGSPKKTPLPGGRADSSAGKLANVKRLWHSPTLMLVFSTSPPMSRLPIERLTVTVELVASRLARSD